jgi:hypothetical protein
MSHWLIRANAPSVSVDLPKNSCVIESRRRPRIAAHDVLVLLKRTSAGATFSSSAEVTHVATTDSGEVGGLRQTKIETGDWISLPDDSTVEVLRFSLTIVHNLRNPQHHFRGGYRRLPREDFDTIRSGEAFVARTTYFELLGALPEDLRNQFRAGELLSSSFELGQPTFEARLHRLCEFLSMRVLSVGKLLEQLSDVLERAELRDERGRSYAHQFFDDDGLTGRGDDIEKQAAVFRDLADALGEQEIAHEEGQPVRRDTLSTVLTEIQTKDRLPRESLFELLFRGRGDDL